MHAGVSSAINRSPHRRRMLQWLVGLLLVPAMLPANIRELQIAGAGSADQQRVQSALLNNGMIVFVWEDQSGSDSEIRYRLFNPATSVFSNLQTANAAMPGDQVDPAVASLSGGGFAIAFASRATDTDYDVLFRRFDASGTPLDESDLAVANLTDGSQQHPDIITLNNGSLVVAFSGPGVSGQGLFFRRFDSDGMALDPDEVPLNSFGSDVIEPGDQGALAISAFPGGGWVAVFENRVDGEIYAVRFGNDGAPVPDPEGGPGEYYFQVNAATDHEQFAPAVAAFGNGQFAAAYNSDTDGTANGRRVMLRFFDAGGPATTEMSISQAGMRSQDPHCVVVNGSHLVVAWKTLESTGGDSVWSVWSQMFQLDGTPAGAPLFMHAGPSLNRGRPHVIPWMSGGYSTVWETGDAGGSISGRTVAPVGVSPGMLSMMLGGETEPHDYQVSFLGFPGECYQLQAASEFGGWSSILTTNAPDGGFEYVDLNGSTTPYRFFRVERLLTNP